jgi:heat shock protein HspQ
MAAPHPNVVANNAMSELQPWQHVVIQDDRQEYLEWIYKLDGRDQKSHPMHGLYTGLEEQYKNIFAV